MTTYMCFNFKKNTSNKELIFPYQFYRGWYFPIIRFYIAKDQSSTPIGISALVDSGANLSIFNKETAEALGFTMSSGRRRSFSGVSGGSYGYAHQIYFDVLGVKFQDEVIFSSDMGAYFNLIGRESFFSQFNRICFDENNRQTILIKK